MYYDTYLQLTSKPSFFSYILLLLLCFDCVLNMCNMIVYEQSVGSLHITDYLHSHYNC